jgi:hypothetical protein
MRRFVFQEDILFDYAFTDATSEIKISKSAESTSRPRGRQHTAHHFRGQCLSITLQSRLSGFAILIDIGLCPSHLRLRFVSSFVYGRGSRIQRRFAPSLLPAEDNSSRLAQALFELRSACLGGGDVGPRLFDCALGFAAPLRQHALQRLVQNRRIERIEQRQQNHCGHGSKQ